MMASDKIKMESMRSQKLCGDEVDLSSVLARTLTDLQVMKTKYEDGLSMIQQLLNSIQVKTDLELGLELIESGLKVHSTLLDYVSSLWRLFCLNDHVVISRRDDNNIEGSRLNDKREVQENSDDLKNEVDVEYKYVKEDLTIKLESTITEMEDKVIADDNHIEDVDIIMEDHHDYTEDDHDDMENGLGDTDANLDDREDTQNDTEDKIEDENKNLFVPKSDEDKIFDEGENPDDLPEKEGEDYHFFQEGYTLSTDHKCKVCSKEFSNWRNLRYHVLKVHERRHKCDQCDKAFAYENLLRSHQEDHALTEDLKCDTCDRTYKTINGFNKHMKIHQDKPNKCEHCGEHFKFIRSLKVHMKTHEGVQKRIRKPETPGVCDVCGKFFKNLRGHRRAHFQAAIFKCDKCPSAFKAKYVLNKHFQLMHVKDESSICCFCSKSLENNEKLKAHLYRCGMQERKFPCVQCGKSFVTNADLSKHMLIHQDERSFKCDQCDKTFKHRRVYKRHIFIHSGEKPFECDRCDKAFPFKMYLDNHYRVHTGEKPFQCKFCGKDFSLQSDMYKHRRKVHK